jgi:integrase
VASIEQRGTAYRVVWRHERRKQSTTWPTLAEAEQAADIAKAHRHRIDADAVYTAMGVDVADDPPGLTLADWAAEWLASRTRISPDTRRRYAQQLRDQILPTFGGRPLADITGVMVGAWLAGLAEGRRPTTVTRYYSLLHAILAAAVRAGHITRNPCAETDFVRDQVADDDTGEHHAVYLTPAQFDLLRSAHDERWRPLLDCLVETGARWSEATALAAKHLIPPTGTTAPRLRIWRAWKGAGPRRRLGTTKGRSKRTLPIGADLYATLAKLVDGQGPDTLIFRDVDGAALDYDVMYRQVWVPALLRARRCPDHPPANRGAELPGATGRCRDHGGRTDGGRPCGALVAAGRTRCPRHYGPPPGAVSECDCPGVLRLESSPGWHDLRHTHAAWLFSDPRMTPLAISRRLGHQQLSTTSEIYGDLMPEAEEMAVDAIRDARRRAAGG